MADRDVAHRAAVLNVDRGFKDIMRRMKWDLCVDWGKADTLEARENIHADLRALARLESKVAALADNATLDKRKEHQHQLRQQAARGFDRSPRGPGSRG